MTRYFTLTACFVFYGMVAFGQINAADAYFQQGLDAENRQDYTTAIDLYKESIAKGNTTLMPLTHIAQCALSIDDFELVKTTEQQLSKKNHKMPILFYGDYASLALEQKDYALALRMVYKGRAIENNHPNLLVVESQIYSEQGQLTTAMHRLQQAESASPNDVNVLYHLGLIYQAQGQEENAIQAYKRVLFLQPQHPQCLAEMGKIYLDTYASNPNQTTALSSSIYYYEQYSVLCCPDDDVIALLDTLYQLEAYATP